MKAIKIFLSFAGVVLGTFCFGQLPSQSSNDLLFYSSYYNLASNRVEHHVSQFPASNSFGDYFEAPVLKKTYFVSVEFDTGLEDWMTAPFESEYYEEELQLESWMLSPFENTYYEEEILIESWMTEPFGSDEISEEVIEEEVEIEEWMTTPWV